MRPTQILANSIHNTNTYKYTSDMFERDKYEFTNFMCIYA